MVTTRNKTTVARIALVFSLAFTGCYARTAPLPLPDADAPHIALPNPGSARGSVASTFPGAPIPLVVGVQANSPGPQAPGIDPRRVVERVASTLSSAQLFSAVLYPVSELAHLSPDWTLTVSVSSSLDLHAVENLAKDIAVGVSVLLLQPVLPTTYDLRVEIEAQIHSRDGKVVASYAQAPSLRFESNWISPDYEARAEWRDEAVALAVAALIDEIASDRTRLRDTAEPS
ncbi:hypothetical protein MK489_00260 [Myxococcota bacterium]|nr:hypothetical protein [Myxococcota bacterium]